MTEDALLNTPITALVMLGAATAIAIAIKANTIRVLSPRQLPTDHDYAVPTRGY